MAKSKSKTKPKKPRKGKRELTPLEERRLRELVPDPDEQEVFREMVEDGILELPLKPFDEKAFERYKPVKVRGSKLISESIIEERR